MSYHLRRIHRIVSSSSLSLLTHRNYSNVNYTLQNPLNYTPCVASIRRLDELICGRWLGLRRMSNSCVGIRANNDGVVRFSFGDSRSNRGLKRVEEDTMVVVEDEVEQKKNKMKKKVSKKRKRNELRFYRLKAKKKMNSPNPEVRIRYKLDKAKRKEAWLIEKLRKFELPKAPAETYDPEILTEEEKFYLKRTGEKKKNYVPVGRRGVFGGVVLNMHLHWKNHETVKVVCKPCRPGQVHDIAEELTRLSKGIVIEIKPDNTIIFYRGKNYVRPDILSPLDTLSKAKALEKYKYEQSLEHTSQFIEKLEIELGEYHEHLARFRGRKDDACCDSAEHNRCGKSPTVGKREHDADIISLPGEWT